MSTPHSTAGNKNIPTTSPRPDTSAWILQSWAFFAGACLFESLTIYWLDLSTGIRWLMELVLVLAVYVCFALSKMIRDNRDGQVDTSPWILMTWLVSGVAVLGLIGGLNYVATDWRVRMILVGGIAWCIQSSLLLAKTIRDNDEARRAQAEIKRTGTESVPTLPLVPEHWSSTLATPTAIEPTTSR